MPFIVLCTSNNSRYVDAEFLVKVSSERDVQIPDYRALYVGSYQAERIDKMGGVTPIAQELYEHCIIV